MKLPDDPAHLTPGAGLRWTKFGQENRGGTIDMKRSATILMAALGLSALPAFASAAQASSNAATDSAPVQRVCLGNDLTTTDEFGSPIPAARLDLLRKSVQSLCDSPATQFGTTSQAVPLATTQGYVEVDLFGTATTLYASGKAWGLYYNYKTATPRNEVNCIYRLARTAGAWHDCGYGAGTTSVTTSQLVICPLPGVYEGYATLFVNGVKKKQDYGTAVVG
ncbi:MAG: hypothetical protein U0R27_00690 [Candidatus Nanopelagicales bacterium]